MLILSNEDIEQMITMHDCMNVMEEMYRDLGVGKALFMPRVDNLLPCKHEGAYYGFKYMGGGWPRRLVMALRLNSDIITHPKIDGKQRRVKVPKVDGRWVGLVQLFSTETGKLLTIFPDGVVQRMRVGATNGLGIKYLAEKDARRVGLIGSGWQAGAQVMGVLAARDITQIKVFSLTKQNRESFCEEMRRTTGANIFAVDTVEECVRDVEIIMAATSSINPVIMPHWLHEGLHVSCIKSQEVDESVFERCNRIVVHTKIQSKQTDNVLQGTRHIPEAHLSGWWKEEKKGPRYFPDLADIITGQVPGRIDNKDTTCFVNNIGLGLQFAAVGALILEKAKEYRLGTDLPDEMFSETVHP